MDYQAYNSEVGGFGWLKGATRFRGCATCWSTFADELILPMGRDVRTFCDYRTSESAEH